MNAPKNASKKILVTSALPYVNNIPHLGNMMCIISGDVYTRFLRSKGHTVISVLGTDEHGTTTQTKALEEGVSPREICDKYFAIHKRIYEWFNTSYDCLGRTSAPENHEISSDIFLKLHKNGFILQKESEQFYDEERQMFLADRFVEGTCPHCQYAEARGDQCDKCGNLLEPNQLINPRSKLSGKTPIKKKSNHLYIDLPKLEPTLRQWITSKESNWSENARTITHAWLDKMLEPRAITRDLKWGIPVPLKGFEDKVFYSWFDAPIGYISITKECRKDWHDWWHNNKDVRLVQFMGKDNTQFHTILFPAFLLGAKDDYTLLDTISVNEFLNYADGKFSKSRGTGVFGDSAIETGIHPDAYRYYLIAIRPEKEDTTFDWLDFGQKINRELIDNYANLVNRVISFTNRFMEGKVPKITKDDLNISNDFRTLEQLYDDISLKAALKQAMGISKSLNQYFQEKQPWKTIKDNPAAAQNTIAILLNRINDITIALAPVIPALAAEVFNQLNSKHQSWNDIGKITLPAGHALAPEKPLLPKLEDTQIASLRERFKNKQTDNKFPLNLKVAQVLEVKEHPNATKLYVLKLNVGDHERQIVSGLRDHLKPEEIIGKKIILVSNLKPAQLRGVESQGMLLAGMNADKKLALLEVKHSKPGDAVVFEGYSSNTQEIAYEEFAKLTITVKDKKVIYEGKQLKTTIENVTCDLGSGKVS
ncbi:MAG TPA: methionine--tRNA ligase [Acidobacteriota bacterium]|nr:methionine--tRNA ligase [Acidobacteriota bacterium]